MLKFRSMTALYAQFCLYVAIAVASAQDSKVLGEVKFQGATKVERSSGVWVDGDYVGFLKELHGDKKVMLLPGDHEISVRQSGYDDFLRKNRGGTRASTNRSGNDAPQPSRCDT